MQPQIILLVIFIAFMLSVALWIEFKVHKTKVRIGKKAWIYTGVSLILLFAFCSSFHLVSAQGRLMVKDHFTLRYTIITSDDEIEIQNSCVQSLGMSDDCKLAKRLRDHN